MMNARIPRHKTEAYLRKLCLEIPSRRVGSEGNRTATDYLAGIVASFGFQTESPSFDCLDWTQAGAVLTGGGLPFQVFPSPYSLGCQIRAPLAVASTAQELEDVDCARAILLLRGDLAKEQLMPKNFPFYNPDRHRRIIGLLEQKGLRAIVAATSRDLQMVGSQYPFPLFEDGDFDIPSVFMTDEEGQRLAALAGKEISLESRATRIPAKSCNVVARKGADSQRRVVLFAHIDARMGTPGAGDNASGVVVLLLLAELLANYDGRLGIELVALNGEDYYSNPGEQLYLAQNADRFGEIVLGINLDDLGYHKGRAAYSLYGCSPELADPIRLVFSQYPELVEGEPWFQGDHGLFLMKGRPALAITSELLSELMANITHTPNDRPELIDPERLAAVAMALRDLLQNKGTDLFSHLPRTSQP
ncbi:MAG: M28 family peptidase [Coprothermobacterota bacterium]|nr:M28 family peptidase [Coprothermobacterota bacterium]